MSFVPVPASPTPNLNSSLLHLGCGLEAPGEWLNVDGSMQATFARWPRLKMLLVKLRVYPKSQASIPWPLNVLRLDLRKPLPFPTGRFTGIYSSHTLEHLYRAEALKLAAECHRVLRPGGIFRVVVPDLESAINRYFDRKAETAPSVPAADQLMRELLFYPEQPASGLLGVYHRLLGFHHHKWMYDSRSLIILLERAGFSDVQARGCREGDLPGLEKIENSARLESGAGIAVEARKM